MHVEKALLSVYDKEGIADLGRVLSSLGVTVYSTGGTLRMLQEEGIRATSVESVTGTPELLSGRVKTLHPTIFAGILAKRDDPEHMRQLDEHGIPCIDMVVCNLYPFARVVARPDVQLDEALENIDIGGVTLIRAAAKNYRDVAVLTDPRQYERISELLASERTIDEKTSWELAREAFDHILRYDEAISDFYRGYRSSAGDS